MQLHALSTDRQILKVTCSNQIIGSLKLTRKELQVLREICKGYSMNAVAKRLHLAPSTIITHKRNLFSKFGINNLVRLGVLAERHGFLVNL